MVYPWFAAGTKTEGDNSNKTCTKTPNDSSSESLGSSSSSRSGCLFDSNEELLHFELGSNLHRPTTTIDQQHHLRTTATSTLEDGFSLDSRHRYYPQEAPLKKQKKNCRSHPWSRYWKTVKRRHNRQFTRLLKMGLKRYYLLLLCLILVIVSCLIASFAISRSVGELDTDDSSGSRSSSISGGDGNDSATGSKPAGRALSLSSSAPREFEQRTIDLIDLIQCGKTFAFTKIRIKVRVPKNSKDYKQKPGFLQQQQQQQANSGPQTSTETTDLLPNDGFPIIQHDQRPVKFILTNARDTTSALDSAQLESGVSELPSGDGTRITSSTAATNPLSVEIKPVPLPEIIDTKAKVTPPPLKELTALLVASTKTPPSTTTQAPDEYPLPLVGELLGDSRWLDPLEAAASELRVLATSINRTLVDCFFIDIEKRFWQKVSFEDKYRQVASTRHVPFSKMMQTLIECRQLTWSSLPPVIKIKQIPVATTAAATSGSEQPLVAANSAPSVTAALMPSDQQSSGVESIGAILGGWIHGYNNGDVGESTTTSAKEPTGMIVAAESRQGPQQTVAFNAAQTNASEEEKRQGSYLNMGISMVSGIVPNTLWCGLGDRAANYSELGAEFQVDSCCRAHDHCPIRLKPFSADYGLINWSMSTRSHCDCDIDFSNCLNSVNSTLSNVIRVLYFRFVGLQCIDVEGRDFKEGATM